MYIYIYILVYNPYYIPKIFPVWLYFYHSLIPIHEYIYIYSIYVGWARHPGLGLGLAKCPAAQGPEVSPQQHAGHGASVMRMILQQDAGSKEAKRRK